MSRVVAAVYKLSAEMGFMAFNLSYWRLSQIIIFLVAEK